MPHASRFVTALACLCLPSIAQAQFTEKFDASTEGFVGPSYTTSVGTFEQLVLDDGSAGQFAIEDASGATFSNGLGTRSPPNMLGVGGFAAGPGFNAPKVRSFRWLLPHAVTSLRFEMYHCTYGLSSNLRIDFMFQGQVVTTGSYATPIATLPPVMFPTSISTCSMLGGNWQVDELRFYNAGQQAQPRFTVAFDDIRMAVASCDAPPRICTGVGTAACPCGNTPLPGTEGGCLHSSGASALLSGVGTASIGADDFQASATAVPNTTMGMLIGSSTTMAPAAFGDGVLCVGPAITRIRVSPAVGTTIAFGGGIAAASGLTAAGTQRLQAWYRDAGAFCSSDNFNLSNGIEVTWAP